VIDACLVLLATNEKPTVPDVLPIVNDFYRIPGNEVGGALHITLEDGNVEDGNVRFCVEVAVFGEGPFEPDPTGLLLGLVLLRMTKTQRLKLANRSGWSA